MAKLTLSFKGRLLAVHRLERPIQTIGRDPDCEIAIDSLAVAPRHAQIQAEGESFVLTALDPGHAVLRNGERVQRAVLAEGDLLLIGKHTLVFSQAAPESILLPVALAPQRSRREDSPEPADPIPVYLQIQSGPHIGHVIPLIRAVTRLTAIGGHEAIVTRREGRYLLSRIGEANRVYVDRYAVQGNEEVALVDGCLVDVDGTQCRFFCPDDRAASDSPASTGLHGT